MKIVFMGTPEFAVPTLKSLCMRYDVKAVVTMPDTKSGRGYKLTPPPVKIVAQEFNVPILQPYSIKEPEIIEKLEEIGPDAIIVAAFGKILPESILDMPKYGCINLHASLLPKYRGASPIQNAIINGDKQTGVTAMYMAKGLDTGDIIDVEKVQISSDDTAETLSDKLSVTGAKLILRVLESIENKTAKRVPQDEEKATYTTKIIKEMGAIDFCDSAKSIECLVRGLYPKPGAYAFIDDKKIKICKAFALEKETSNRPGTIIEMGKNEIAIATGKGVLKITRLQPEGKKEMDAVSFFNGYTPLSNVMYQK